VTKRSVSMDEVLRMFRDGKSAGEISVVRGTSMHITISNLLRLIGQGKLRRSDVFYSIPREWREPIITIIDVGATTDPERVKKELDLNGHPVPLGDVQVVCAFYDRDSPFGDMYEDLRSIECELHWLVRHILVERYGDGESGWWRQGVPRPIRTQLVTRREEDPEPRTEAYFYTDLIHLWEIIDKNWPVMVDRLPKLARDKRRLKADVVQLNRIRNQVMHPVRGEELGEEHFEFVRDLRIKLGFRLDLSVTEGMADGIS
jgi:hypothetical protein